MSYVGGSLTLSRWVRFFDEHLVACGGVSLSFCVCGFEKVY